MVDDKSELSEAATTDSAPVDAAVDVHAPENELDSRPTAENSSPPSRDEAAPGQPADPSADPSSSAESSGDPADPEEVSAEDASAEEASAEEASAEGAGEAEGKDAPAAQPLELIEEPAEEADDERKDWYILKVQVNREKSICDALRRRVKIAELDSYFGEVLIPTEDVREFNKSGKQRIVKRKLYPGYILVNMAINDDTWFLVRETPGIGDFTGAAGKPTPMEKHEVDRILKSMRPADEEGSSPEKTNIRFKHGDRVRVKEGYFQNFEGEVESIDEANGRITVMINIFGRPTPVELDHWQFEDV